MEIIIIVLLVLFIIVIAVFALMLQQQIRDLARTMDQKLGEGSKTAQEGALAQSRESRELIQKVGEQLLRVEHQATKASESSKQVITIAERIQSLEKVLTNPKHRGNWGEMSLELELGNMLTPTDYERQYQFPDGDTVDAVIKTPEGLIPIDAKFPYENYKRFSDETDDNKRADLEKVFADDLKKRINETAKYIRPKDRTLEFALMYIPSEAIYYDLLVNEVGGIEANKRSLIDYAYKDKNVVIVSPTTFVAYLHVIRYGFNAFKIEESSKELRKNVEALLRHFKVHDEYLTKMGNSLSTTVNHYNSAYKELGKIDKDVAKISGSSAGIEPLALERPLLEGDEQE